MEPFIRPDQLQFLNKQTKVLLNAYASINDIRVLNALRSLTAEKAINAFDLDVNEEQKKFLESIIEIKEAAQARDYLEKAKNLTIPFKRVTEQTLKKLFPKVKKLKLPDIEENDLRELTYIGWDEKGTNKKFLIAHFNDKFVGLQGTFTPLRKKGICRICGHHEEIGLFMSEIKGREQGTYTRRGNYICKDSTKCNENLVLRDELEKFIHLLSH